MPVRRLLSAVAMVIAPLTATAQAGDVPGLPERSFSSAGVPITYVDSGRGPVVVLLHGNGSHLRWWYRNGVAPQLARRFRVIAFDARGHGRSGKPHDPAAYGKEYALDVVRLLDHLGIRRAHIVGYSMGAMTTVQLLTLHPERAITAVLGGAAGRISPSPAFEAQMEKEAAERERDCISRSQVNRLMPPGTPPMTDSAFQSQRAICLADPFMDGKALGAASRSAGLNTITEAQVAAIRVPMFGVVGAQDPYVTDFEKFGRWNPLLKAVTVPGGTHYSVFREPGPLLAAIETWLLMHADRP